MNWTSSKFKTFALQKTLMKRQATESEKKNLQTTYLRKNSYLEHIKNSQNSSLKNQAIQLENGQKT